MVDVDGIPRPCAVRITSIHCRTFSLFGLSDRRTLSSRISAAVPGMLFRPASFNISRYSCNGKWVFSTIGNFHRRVGMHVKLRKPRFDSPQQLHVIITVEIFREAALNADLGRALPHGFDRFCQQGIGGMKVSVRSLRPAAETAK